MLQLAHTVYPLGMAMRIYLPMRIDADIRIIRHMSDIARYMRILMRISASAWPSLVDTRPKGQSDANN